MLPALKSIKLRFTQLLVTIIVIATSSVLFAIDPPANWNEMTNFQKTLWLFRHSAELQPGDLERLFGVRSEMSDLKNLSAGELLNLLTDPKGIPLFNPSPSATEDEERILPSLPRLTREQVEELLKIDTIWRRLVGSSLNKSLGRVSEQEFNRALDLIERMDIFKNRLLFIELGDSPSRRLLYRQLTEQAHTASSIPNRLEMLSDFFRAASQRTQNQKLRQLLDSISRNVAIFHLELVSFRTIERFFIFEMRRELRRLKTKRASGAALSEGETKLAGFLEQSVGEGNKKAVKAALALPGLVKSAAVASGLSAKEPPSGTKGHRAFIRVLEKISELGKPAGQSATGYANRAKALLAFFESNGELTTELLERTSNISPHEIPARLREELATFNSSGGKSADGEIIKHPRGLGLRNSLIYEKNRFMGFVGSTLHFYLAILLSDELLRLTFYTGEYRDDTHLPFFTNGKELLFNVGSHIHFATFSMYVAANRSAYNGAIRGLVTRLPILKFIAGRNPVGLLFSEFVGFMPGMTANNAMWGSLAHSATPEAYFLLTRGYFEEAGRLVSIVWNERIAQLSLAARMGTVTGVFYAMRLAQQLIVCAFKGASAAAHVHPAVGFAWTVATFAVAAVVEHYLADWYTSLEANSYIDSSTENLLEAEGELASDERLTMTLQEIPGLEDGIHGKFGIRPETYLYFKRYFGDLYNEITDEFERFIEDCWASILNGNGEFGKLVLPLIRHPEAKEIVRRINLIEMYIDTRERHITTGMHAENASKELELALQYIDDLSASFKHHFGRKQLESLPYLFEKAARVRIYSAFIPTQFDDAKGLSASKFSMEKAYMEYENAWKNESILASRRDKFTADLNEILRQRNDLRNMDGEAENSTLSEEINKKIDQFSEELAKEALRLELHKIMKEDFWRRCRKAGFLSLDGWQRDWHPCAREQKEVEFEWRGIKSAPASRFILDRYDLYYNKEHEKSSALYKWASEKATELKEESAFYIGDGPEWVSEKDIYVNSADGGITFTPARPDTPWGFLPDSAQLKEGKKAAEAFIVNLNPLPKDYDDDLFNREEQESGVLIYKLRKVVEENNMTDDIDLHSDIQSSWIRALITDPMSGNNNEREYSEAADEVKRVSGRDWSTMVLYKNGKIDKKSVAAKTSEELAFWLNGYINAKREGLGKGAGVALQEWWLRQAIDATEELAKERESLRLIAEAGLIPLPQNRDQTTLEAYRELVPNPFDRTRQKHLVKAADLNDPAINIKVVEFFSKADPTGVLKRDELPPSISTGMTNPYDKDKTDEQSSLEDEITPEALELINRYLEAQKQTDGADETEEAKKKAIRWTNTILLEESESPKLVDVYGEIISFLTEGEEGNFELFDFAYNINELIQNNYDATDSVDYIQFYIELFNTAKEFIIELEAQKDNVDTNITWENALLAPEGFHPPAESVQKLDKLIEKLNGVENGREFLEYLIYVKGRL